MFKWVLYFCIIIKISFTYLYILLLIFSGNPVLFALSPEQTKNKVVCDQHFDEKSFFKKATTAKGRTLLRKDAVPKPYKSGVIGKSSNENVSVEVDEEERREIISLDDDDEDSPEIIDLKCQEIVDSDESVVEIDSAST